MTKIVLARVDDRLIHGQVMTAWIQYTGGNHIVIVDDVTAQDDFTKQIMQMAVPTGIKLDIYNVQEAPQKINANQTDKLIILAKTPQVFLQLIQAQVALPGVIIGGMGANKDRQKVYKNIFMSAIEKQAVQAIGAQGVAVKIQVIPDEKALSIEKVDLN